MKLLYSDILPLGTEENSQPQLDCPHLAIWIFLTVARTSLEFVGGQVVSCAAPSLLFSYYPIFISHAEIWTIVIGSGNKAVHLIFIQIHLTGIALIIVIIRIIYTVLAVYSLLVLHYL